MKICPDCPPGMEWHHDSAFYRNQRRKDGLDLYCKECRKARTNKHRRENPDYLRELNLKRALQKRVDDAVEKAPSKRSEPRYKGVHKRQWVSKRDCPGELMYYYYARLMVDGQRRTLVNQWGTPDFATGEDAARAYDAELDRLNLPRVRNRDLYPNL